MLSSELKNIEKLWPAVSGVLTVPHNKREYINLSNRLDELADEVERRIIVESENIESVLIHIEPSTHKLITAIIPVEEIKGLESKVSGHFGRAPYFVILKIKNKKKEIEDFYLNEFLHKTKHIGLNVVKVVINYGLDMLFTTQIGEISFYMLKNNFIDIYQIPEANLTVKEVIEQYYENQLLRITMPTHSVDEAIVETDMVEDNL